MRLRPWAIGLFILAGFACFTGILFLIGSRENVFSQHLDLYTEFTNVNGLTNGAKVRVSGFDSGELEEIELPKTPSGKFRLHLQVKEKTHAMIRKDSVVSIATEGVVGDKYVSIKKGSDQSEEAQKGSTLPSKEPFEMTALLEKSSGLLNDVHGSITDIRGRVDEALDSITRTVNHTDGLITKAKPDVLRITSDGRQITGKIDNLVTDLNSGQGPAGMLLKDEKTKQQLQATLQNVKQITVKVDQASEQANRLLADFQTRDLAAKTQATLANAQSMTAKLDNTLTEALAKDDMGEDGASNLRRTLSNLNRTSANLAQDTEALKHNFLLRGFFKDRGFYNLDQLTREDYLKALKHNKDEAGPRLWLQASSLVSTDPSGLEQLSEAGRSQIDSAVSPVVGSLSDRLLVVEGYSLLGSPDQQYRLSRRRAQLVREYLETHFHLNHANIGIVPMLSQAPPKAERETWSGAAIMLLRSKSN